MKRHQYRTLATLRDTLLPELLSGALRRSKGVRPLLATFQLARLGYPKPCLLLSAE